MKQRASQLAEEALGLVHEIKLQKNPAAPLAFFVHGRAGNVSVMWTFSRALSEAFSIISVQAIHPDPIGGFSWWDATQSNSRAEIKNSEEKLSEFIKKAVAWYALTPSSVFAFGFSQGAALLSLVAQKTPIPINGIALLAGFVLRSEEKPTQTIPSLFIAHGTNDEIVPISKARDGAEYFRSLGANLAFHEEPVGHKVGSKAMNELKGWVAQLEISHNT